MRPATVNGRGRRPRHASTTGWRGERRDVEHAALARDLRERPADGGVVHAHDQPHVGPGPPDEQRHLHGLQVVVRNAHDRGGPVQAGGGQRLPRAPPVARHIPGRQQALGDRVGVLRARLDDDHGDPRGVQLLDGAQPDAAHAVDDHVPGRRGRRTGVVVCGRPAGVVCRRRRLLGGGHGGSVPAHEDRAKAASARSDLADAAFARAVRAVGRQCSAAGTGSSVFEKWLNARFRTTAKMAVALMPDSKIVASHSGMWL